MKQIENSLKSTSHLKTVKNGPANIFLNNFRFSNVQDDHVPFYERGVPILHLIPNSFPTVWHTNADNGERLDQDAILNFNKVMRAFIVEYLADCAHNPMNSKCRLK